VAQAPQIKVSRKAGGLSSGMIGGNIGSHFFNQTATLVGLSSHLLGNDEANIEEDVGSQFESNSLGRLPAKGRKASTKRIQKTNPHAHQ
jgi:hypothetical protein